MRAKDFLVEYRRDLTAQSVGTKALQALKQDTSLGLSRELKQFKDKFNPNTTTPDEVAVGLDSLLAAIEERDPTANKQFVPWLARMYAKGGLKIEDMNRNDLLSSYEVAKKKKMVSPEHADINRFKSYSDFENAITAYQEKISQAAPKQEPLKGQATQVLNNDEVRIIRPEDQEAACYYGQGTRWCTAATGGNNMFKHYQGEGHLYILIPKNAKYAGEKYQFQLETNQFMNEKDEPVGIGKILHRFPSLMETFENIPEMGNYTIFIHPKQLQNIVKQIAQPAEKVAKTLATGLPPEERNAWYNAAMNAINVSPAEIKAMLRQYYEVDPVSDLPNLLSISLMHNPEMKGFSSAGKKATSELAAAIESIGVGPAPEYSVGTNSRY